MLVVEFGPLELFLEVDPLELLLEVGYFFLEIDFWGFSSFVEFMSRWRLLVLVI